MAQSPPESSEKLEVVRLPPGDLPGGFRCKPPGQADDLGDYLTQGDAQRDEAAGFARTYLVRRDAEFIAYFSLQADAIKLQPDEKVSRVPYASAPAIKLTRLGVRHDLQSNGYGSQLIALVVASALEIARVVGVRYLTLDAVADKKDWYIKKGWVENKVPLSEQHTTEALKEEGECSMRRDLGPIFARPATDGSPVLQLDAKSDAEFERQLKQ